MNRFWAAGWFLGTARISFSRPRSWSSKMKTILIYVIFLWIIIIIYWNIYFRSMFLITNLSFFQWILLFKMTCALLWITESFFDGQERKDFCKGIFIKIHIFFCFLQSLAVPKDSFSNKVGNHILTTQKSFCKMQFLAINQACWVIWWTGTSS